MSITYHSDISRIDWEELKTVIERAPLGYRDVETVRAAFRGSYAYCFAEECERLVAAGRAISDGVTNSAIFDVVVLPEYQRRGIGQGIMQYLLERLPPRSVLLVSIPAHEGFYRRLGFHRLKTAYLRHENIDRWIREGYVEQRVETHDRGA